jgi:hypothetical protein
MKYKKSSKLGQFKGKNIMDKLSIKTTKGVNVKNKFKQRLID